MAARSKFKALLREQALQKKDTIGRKGRPNDDCESPCPPVPGGVSRHQYTQFVENLEQHVSGMKRITRSNKTLPELPHVPTPIIDTNPVIVSAFIPDVTVASNTADNMIDKDLKADPKNVLETMPVVPKTFTHSFVSIKHKKAAVCETVSGMERITRSNETWSELPHVPTPIIDANPVIVSAFIPDVTEASYTADIMIDKDLKADPKNVLETMPVVSKTSTHSFVSIKDKKASVCETVGDYDCDSLEITTSPVHVVPMENKDQDNDKRFTESALTPGPISSKADKVSEKCAAAPMTCPLRYLNNLSSPMNEEEHISVIAVISHTPSQTKEPAALNKTGGEVFDKESQIISHELPPGSAMKSLSASKSYQTMQEESFSENVKMKESLNESDEISDITARDLEAVSFTTPSVSGTSLVPARQLKAGVGHRGNETNITPPISSEAHHSNQGSLPRKPVRELFPNAESDINEHAGDSQNGQWVTFNVIDGDVIPLEPDPADDTLLLPQSNDSLEVTSENIVLERTLDEVNPLREVTVQADIVLQEAGEYEYFEREESNEDNEYDHGDNGTRKRKRNVSSWKRNVAKKALDSGEEHVNTKGKLSRARVMGPGCHENLCRFKCQDKFRNLPNARMQIFKQYWGLQNHTRQWDFLNKHTSVAPTKGNEEKHGKKRQIARKYFLRLNGQMVRVCRQMFLSTLDISETLVKTAHRKLGLGHTISPDKRGKNSKVNPAEVLKSESFIKQHIKKFKSVPSHLCRSRTNRKYLDSSLSVQKMYRMYVEWMSIVNPAEKLCSFSKYNEYFSNNFNLGFHQPKKDLCEECAVFNNAAPDVKRQLQTEHDAHVAKKDDARKLRNEDKAMAKNDDKICFAVFDLQKTMLIPKCEIGPVYYLRKISAYNLTVVEGKLRSGYCYVWNETEEMKGANEVASAVFNFMLKMVSEHKVEEFRLWSDNCAGQNKNKYLFAMYTYFSAKFKVTIYHRYLTTGHTQNDCDSLHSIIERSTGPMTFFVPDQWYAHIESATNGGNQKTVVIKMGDRIMDFHNLANVKQHWTYKKNVNWKKICEVKVDRTAEGYVSVKHSFSDEYITINVNKKPTQRGRPFKVTSYSLDPAYNDQLPLKPPKIKDLAKMCERLIIPQEYHDFYTRIDGFPALNIAILPNLEVDVGEEGGDESENEDLADPSDWEEDDDK